MDEPPIIPAIPLPPTVLPPNPIAIPEASFLTQEALIPQYRPVLLPFASPGEAWSALTPFQQPAEEKEEPPSKKASNTTAPVLIPNLPLPNIQQPIPAPVDNPQPAASRLTEIRLPGTEIKIPIPENELLITAAATAATASVVSVAATMSAQSLAKKMKPIFDQLLKRILKKKKPHESLTYGRKRLAQRRSKRLPSESPVET